MLGFNTDYYASKEIIKKNKLSKNYKIIILGSGGVAKAILQALNDLKFKNLYVTCRNKKKFNKINWIKNLTYIPWKKRNNIEVDIIFNATPLGMFGKNSNKKPIKIFDNYLPKIIFDLPVNPKGIYYQLVQVKIMSSMSRELSLVDFKVSNNLKYITVLRLAAED